jgi:hypothetical protein
MPQAAAGPQGILLGKTNDQRAEHLRKLSLDVMAPQDVVHFLPGRREIECCTAARGRAPAGACACTNVNERACLLHRPSRVPTQCFTGHLLPFNHIL